MAAGPTILVRYYEHDSKFFAECEGLSFEADSHQDMLKMVGDHMDREYGKLVIVKWNRMRNPNEDY